MRWKLYNKNFKINHFKVAFCVVTMLCSYNTYIVLKHCYHPMNTQDTLRGFFLFYHHLLLETINFILSPSSPHPLFHTNCPSFPASLYTWCSHLSQSKGTNQSLQALSLFPTLCLTPDAYPSLGERHPHFTAPAPVAPPSPGRMDPHSY